MESGIQYAINVGNLTKTFNGKTVVDNISIRVPKGKIYGFLGPNGSGKTTSIRMICGLLTPDGGTGTCLGFNIRTEPEKIKRRVGYMTQKFSFWEDMTIQENLAFVADLYGLDNARERVENTLDNLGLAHRANQLAGTLSGGWKQRLALAACTLHDPEVLLLDEPTAGVDPKARREFWDEIHKLADNGMTVLVSTHYMDEAERCHAIIYIAYGKLIAQGSVQEVINQAGLTTRTARGPGVMNIMHALEKHPAVDTIAPFGEVLHISGRDASALDAAISPYTSYPGITWSASETSLEDAFIYYMNRSAEYDRP